MDEKRYLYKQFISNGYPRKFINSCIRSRRNIRNEESSSTPWVTLPYISNVSEATARILRNLNIKVAHKPKNNLGPILSKVKDPIENLEKTGVVYSIPCRNCDKKYIGETGKMLKSRLHEHFLALKRGDSLSQIWNHCSELGHEVAFNETSVLAMSNDKQERLFLEAIYSDGNAYNRHVEVDEHLAAIARNSNRRRRQ
jgi:hypothetical protein